MTKKKNHITAIDGMRAGGACIDALEWMKREGGERKSLLELWRICPRPDWMRWLLWSAARTIPKDDQGQRVLGERLLGTVEVMEILLALMEDDSATRMIAPDHRDFCDYLRGLLRDPASEDRRETLRWKRRLWIVTTWDDRAVAVLYHLWVHGLGKVSIASASPFGVSHYECYRESRNPTDPTAARRRAGPEEWIERIDEDLRWIAAWDSHRYTGGDPPSRIGSHPGMPTLTL
jgi:hypothetical protein